MTKKEAHKEGAAHMPNWCSNRVTFRGTPEECKAFADLVGQERGAFSFDAVVPMPPALRQCGTSDEEAHRLKYGDWERMPWWGAERFATREDALQAARDPENAARWAFAEFGPGPRDVRHVPRSFDDAADMAHTNVLNHGHAYWHPWACEHWGTKWGASEVEWWVCTTTPGTMRVEFETAWAPPMPVVEALSRRFPGATLEVSYDSWESDFEGHATFTAGVASNEHHARLTPPAATAVVAT